MAGHEIEYADANVCARKPQCGCLVCVQAVHKDGSNANDVAEAVAEWAKDGLVIGACTDDDVRYRFGCKCDPQQ